MGWQGFSSCLPAPSLEGEPGTEGAPSQAPSLGAGPGAEGRLPAGHRGPRKVPPSSEGHGPWQRRPAGPVLWRGPYVTWLTEQPGKKQGPGARRFSSPWGPPRHTHSPGSFKYQPEEVPAYLLVLCVASSLLAGKSPLGTSSCPGRI